MTKRSYNAVNDFRGLEEAIESIFNEEDNLDTRFDLVAIPPDPSVLTDEEEGDEDNIHQNILPRDIPGRVEVFNCSNNNECGSSSDEPLPKNQKIDSQKPRWRKCDGCYSDITSKEPNIHKRKKNVVDEIKDQTPVNIFEKFFDEEVFEMIILNTK